MHPAIPLASGRFRDTSGSAPLEHGRTYRYTLLTHCGLGRSHIDVDGSFWEPLEPGPIANPPPGFSNPTDEGTLVIPTDSPDRLVYTSSTGVQATFRRAGRTLDFYPCA
jgi:hypothetical protein